MKKEETDSAEPPEDQEGNIVFDSLNVTLSPPAHQWKKAAEGAMTASEGGKKKKKKVEGGWECLNAKG